MSAALGLWPAAVVASGQWASGWGVPAADSPSPAPTQREIDPERVTPGAIGLAFVVVLGIAVVFLVRSMTKQLAKVPESFDDPDGAGPGVPGSPDGPPVAGRSPRSGRRAQVETERNRDVDLSDQGDRDDEPPAGSARP